MDVENFLTDIERVAYGVSDDFHEREEAKQEMCVAILKAELGHTRSWYLQLARNKAAQYLNSRAYGRRIERDTHTEYQPDKL